MAKKFVLKNYLVSVLRRASYRYPARSEAMRLARVERGLYKCAMCTNLFNNKDIKLDHIDPVVCPKQGFIDWNTFISRLFVQPNQYQVLCTSCHQGKTNAEKAIRKKYKLTIGTKLASVKRNVNKRERRRSK